MNEMEKGCCSAGKCPCYPYCDEMMKENWRPQRKKMAQPAGVTSLNQDSADQMNWGDADQMNRNAANQMNQGTVDLMELAREEEEDFRKIKDLYPDMVKRVLAEVEQVCDGMEYEGSMMFDEMPDKDRILRQTAQIREKLQGELEAWEQEEQKKGEEDLYVMNRETADPYAYSDVYQEPPLYPEEREVEAEDRRPGRRSWLDELIEVLFLQEVHHRRCRNRKCRR